MEIEHFDYDDDGRVEEELVIRHEDKEYIAVESESGPLDIYWRYDGDTEPRGRFPLLFNEDEVWTEEEVELFLEEHE